ncbi:MAG: hypothetical protein Q7R76_05105 [Candidatus Woesearchaeota archaeon]|nr:hypothetical protein [Candidatus Woesearchaeota archaeon]
MGLSLSGVILAIILGTLAAIVYSLRILVLLERRIARIDLTLMTLSDKIFKEEVKIERAERKIEHYIKNKKR